MYEDLVKSLKICGKPRLVIENCIAFHDGCCEAEPGCMYKLMRQAADAIEELSNPQWIRFTTRPPTGEEKEEHPEWDFILDCKLPDDGQDILVSNGRWVTVDTFYSDDGCYLDSNDLEGLWWMPLPEPPKEEE